MIFQNSLSLKVEKTFIDSIRKINKTNCMIEKTSSKLDEHDLEPPLIESLFLNKHKKNSKTSGLNKIIFVLKGNYSLNSSIHGNVNLKKGEGIFIPLNCKYKESGKECILIIIRLEDPMVLRSCKCNTSSKKIIKETNPNNCSFILTANILLEKYLDNLYQYLQDQVGCTLLYEIKTKELIYILTQSYTDTTINKFFLTDNS